MMGRVRIRFSSIMLWVCFLYFLQGWPFGLVNDVIPVLLRRSGTSLRVIGWMTALTLPWSLKWIWAPFLDRAGRRRLWTSRLLFLCGIGLFLSAWSGLHRTIFLLAITIAGITFLSALQDTAIDGYSISFLKPEELGMANGLRVMAFRLALVCSGGVLLSQAGVLGWKGIAYLSGGLLITGSLILEHSGPHPLDVNSHEGRPSFSETFLSFVRKDSVFIYIFFVFLYKLGDLSLAPMIRPFWVDAGLSLRHIGWLQGGVVVMTGTLGAILGGWITGQLGIHRALLWLGLAQAISNLGYTLVAARPSTTLIFEAAGIEAFCGGLGTAVFLAFLMSICDREFAATHYALLTTLYGLGRVAAAALSGGLAEHLGYPLYFALTFFLALPGLMLIPYLPSERPTHTLSGI